MIILLLLLAGCSKYSKENDPTIFDCKATCTNCEGVDFRCHASGDGEQEEGLDVKPPSN
jgi:hypothetical protein